MFVACPIRSADEKSAVDRAWFVLAASYGEDSDMNVQAKMNSTGAATASIHDVTCHKCPDKPRAVNVDDRHFTLVGHIETRIAGRLNTYLIPLVKLRDVDTGKHQLSFSINQLASGGTLLAPPQSCSRHPIRRQSLAKNNSQTARP